jgi:hypothetical protein
LIWVLPEFIDKSDWSSGGNFSIMLSEASRPAAKQGVPRSKMRIATMSLMIGATVALMPLFAHAQTRSGQYTPARPTVSPYLNLLRQGAGPVTNYYTQVRPQQQQQAINQQQQAINLQQQSLMQTQQQGLRTVQEGLLQVREPQVNPTGTGGGFMNYSHFYSFSRSPAIRR